MRLDPRVAFTDRASGSISAGGQNPRFNKITIDGVSASDTFGIEGNNMPTQRQPVSMEAIEALDISLSNYDVTVAGAAGANINAVTKSGTNDVPWLGLRHLPRRRLVRRLPGPRRRQHLDVTGLPFDEFNDDTTYGFTFGGPIIKDKLFFFANYEKFKQTDIGSAGGKSLGTNPLAAGGDFSAADVAEVQRHRARALGLRRRRPGSRRRHRARRIRAEARLEHQRRPSRQPALQQARADARASRKLRPPARFP